MKIYAQQNLQLQTKMVEVDGDSENELRYVRFELDKSTTICGVTFTECFWAPIFCTHPLARYLSHLSALLSFVTVILIPYLVAFQEGSSASVQIQVFASLFYFFELSLNVLHIVPPDLIPSLRETQSKPSIFETRMLILKHWVYKEPWWLLLFFVTALPWGLMANTSQLSQRYGLSALYELRIYYIYRAIQKALRNISYNHYLMRLIQFLIAIFIVANWFACTFYVVAMTNANYDETWLSVVMATKTQPTSPLTPAQLYLLSLYFSFTTAATVGYGDISGQNTTEYACIAIYQVFNLFMMAWVVGNVTVLVTQGNDSTRLYRREFTHMEKYMKKMHLPPDLRDQLRAYMVLKFDLDKEFRQVEDHRML